MGVNHELMEIMTWIRTHDAPLRGILVTLLTKLRSNNNKRQTLRGEGFKREQLF